MDDWPEKRLVHGSVPHDQRGRRHQAGRPRGRRRRDRLAAGVRGHRDPALRERIILAYLGLADRLAMRYRHSRGTSCAGPVAGTPDRSLGELLADPGPREEPEDLLILASMVAALPDLERLLADARVTPDAPGPGPYAGRAPGALTMPIPSRR